MPQDISTSAGAEVKLLLSNPRGLCAGVERALAIVELALDAYSPPIYVRHEIVHNQFLVDNLKKRGVVFVDNIEEIPDESVVIFSAHGVSSNIEMTARKRNLTVIDSTCPLVTKVHLQVARIARAGEECVLIGHSGHPEVEGTLGRFTHRYGGSMHLVESIEQAEKLVVHNADKLHYVSQTTLSIDETGAIIHALRKRFPLLQGPKRDDICYATQNRQNAIKQLCKDIDVLIVVGSSTSSNSRRLQEIGIGYGLESHLLDDPQAVQLCMFKGKTRIGLTAGASAPPELVDMVISRIVVLTHANIYEISGKVENLTFGMPREAKQMQKRIHARQLSDTQA